MHLLWQNFLAALIFGLLIGLERERRKGEGVTRKSAGIRTFGLASFLGAIAMHVGGVLLLAVATASVALLAGISLMRSKDEDPGMTTEVALLAMPLVGAIAMTNIAAAAALSVGVATVLAVKAPLHRFVRGVLRDAEINDALILAVATLVIWPQLPDAYLGPWNAINLHTIWLFVVLVLGVNACGRAIGRICGSRIGMPIAGFISGFVSSTATIGSMAAQSRAQPSIVLSAVAGAALSNIATFVQMGLLLFAISEKTFLTAFPILLIGGAVAAAYGAAFLIRSLKTPAQGAGSDNGVISLKAALLLAITVSVISILVGALRDHFGSMGAIFGAALSGLVDAHAAAISIASLAEADKLMPRDAILPILVAMTTNTASKCVVAVSAGTKAFDAYLVPGLVLPLAAAWVTMRMMEFW